MTPAMVLHIGLAVVAAVLILRAAVLRRRDEGIAGLALVVAFLASSQDVPGDFPADVERLIAIAVLAACLLVALGALSNRPTWLAYRLGLVRVPAEVEVDGAIIRLVNAFNEVLTQGESTKATGEALGSLRARAEDIRGRLRALESPSPEWDHLISDYVSLVEIRLRHFGTPLPDEAAHEFKVINDRATSRLTSLRRAFVRAHEES